MPKNKGGSGEKPPGYREPTPIEIRRAPPHPQGPDERGGRRSIIDEISENLNATMVVWAAVLALMAADPSTRKEGDVPAPSVGGSQESGPPERRRELSQGDQLLVTHLKEALRRLQGVMQGGGDGKIARIKSASTPIREKCLIAGSIAKEHMGDIVKIATFLQLSAALIPDDELRRKIEEDMRKAGVVPQDFLADPAMLQAMNRGRIESTKAYAAVTSCGFFVLTFLGGILESGINKNMGLAEPVVTAVIRGVEEGKPQAREAAQALLNMSRSLLP
jgi:hypothetical protein